MNRSILTTTRALALLACVGGAGACDVLIGIDDLKTAPDEPGISCETPADCPSTGNPCFIRACTSQGICELRDAGIADIPTDPNVGDCQRLACVDSEPTPVPDANDVPSDGNECTLEGCSEDGQLMQANADPGTACATGVCDGSGSCVECVGPSDCPNANQDCVGFVCVGMGCDDGAQNGNETDIDCGGGDCPRCGVGDGCAEGSDCNSGVCEGSGGQETCQAPSCSDNVHNALETDVDCGGLQCDGCPIGDLCEENSDCEALYCHCGETECRCDTPACDDGVKNGTELAVDCGPECNECADGGPCQESSWCASKVCEGDVCQVPTCEDGVLNGLEAGVDCGAPQDCPPCNG
jgi:hypothetical protein